MDGRPLGGREGYDAACQLHLTGGRRVFNGRKQKIHEDFKKL